MPPVFGNLRGTPQTRDVDAAQPKNEKINGKKGSIPSQREHSAFGASAVSWACPALPSQARGIWNSLQTTLEYCTWQTASSYPTELQNCHFPDPGGHCQQLRTPSVTIHRFHLPAESQVRSQEQHRWGGEAPLLGAESIRRVRQLLWRTQLCRIGNFHLGNS